MSELSQRIANLSPEKRKLLLQKLNEKKGNLFSPTAIAPQSRKSNSFPLSFAQQRLWFIDQLNPDSAAYNIFQAIRFEGQFNVSTWERSINEIVKRHETLRTTFVTVDGQPLQVIAPTLTLTIPVVDIQELPPTVRERKVQQLATEQAQRPFDLTKGPLLRVMLLQLGQTEYVMLFVIHHIVCDGWSVGILIQELSALYKDFNSDRPVLLPELPIQYIDFAIWQRQWFQQEELERQLAYWKQQLASAPSVTELPTDRPRPVVQTYQGATQFLQLSITLTKALKALSQQEGVTLFMTLLAAFKTLLHRYNQHEDILVGTTVSGRNRVETEGLIGFFVNTLVMRTYFGGNPSFRELLARVRQVALEAYAHQDLPFEQILEELKLERHLSHTPLFQVMFQLQNFLEATLELPGLTVSSLDVEKGIAKFELVMEMIETEQGLIGIMEYNSALFDEVTISRMLSCFQTLLEGIVANPDQRLSNLPLLTPVQEQVLLIDWNDTSVDYPQQLCIHQLVEAQVEKTPDAVAVVFEDEQLTYQELNARANQLAHYLRSLGVKPEVLVGICVERSLCMIIGLLAILKAAGAYVPLDPSYPQQRLAFILEDAQVPVLLTTVSLLEAMPQHKAQVICLDTDWHLIEQQSQEDLFFELTTDNLAYVIYTSGSTGKPKGVQIPHIALSNFLFAMKQSPGITKEDTLIAVTTYSFDIAALELFLPIIVGACLLITSREVVLDGTQLSATLTDSQTTVMQATPATWQLLLAANWDGNNQLKILCGGEALPGHLANELQQRCHCLWNMYGPTETTIWSAASLVKTFSQTVPISQPIANTQFYILDQYHQLVPVGVAGEVCISGQGLARGYFHRPDLTAEKFIPNPFSDKATRLYKTGDLARYLPTGEIEYIGRIDHQVKIRGFRIELGEIEAALSQHSAVRESVVVVRSDSADSQQIVAYVVPEKQQTLKIAKLRIFLESNLPSYMIPAAFVTLEALPLTPNGKIDRKALPATNVSRNEVDFVLPHNSTEKIIATIYTEILKQEKISINDNFFELGGHSLLATQVISRLREAFEIDFPVRILFEKPTVASLAEYIETTSLAIQQISRLPIAQEKGRKEIKL